MRCLKCSRPTSPDTPAYQEEEEDEEVLSRKVLRSCDTRTTDSEQPQLVVCHRDEMPEVLKAEVKNRRKISLQEDEMDKISPTSGVEEDIPQSRAAQEDKSRVLQVEKEKMAMVKEDKIVIEEDIKCMVEEDSSR